jgi:hypothetical protein
LSEHAHEPARDERLDAEQLIKQLKVSDLLVGTLASLVQLGYAKLAEGETEEARLAIEALRTLVPVLEGSASDDAIRDLRQATANLQLAYADHVAKPREAPAEPAAEPRPEPTEPEPKEPEPKEEQ